MYQRESDRGREVQGGGLAPPGRQMQRRPSLPIAPATQTRTKLWLDIEVFVTVWCIKDRAIEGGMEGGKERGEGLAPPGRQMQRRPPLPVAPAPQNRNIIMVP